MNSSFHRINACIHGCIVDWLQSIPRKDRPSPKASRRLAQCIALVALSLRSACLVDFCRIAAPRDTLPHLIDNLRKKCTACAVIFALLDPTNEDVYFVNWAMINRKLGGSIHNGSALEPSINSSPLPTNLLVDTAYVSLDKPPRLLDSMPQPLVSLLSFLRSNLPASSDTDHNGPDKRVSEPPGLLVLPSSNLGPAVQVPLAGILLDYPFVYVPLEPRTNNEAFLGGEVLDVFEILLESFQTGERLELMKFSCPAEFSAATSTLNTICGRLGGAIGHLNSNRDEGHGPHWEIVSEISQTTIDRVAL